MKVNLQKIWEFMGRNKYVITLAIFAIIIVFLDENNAIRRIGYQREIMQLNADIEKYRAEYEDCTEKLNQLDNDPEMLEKIAREKYLMKKPNEDVFVFDK